MKSMNICKYTLLVGILFMSMLTTSPYAQTTAINPITTVDSSHILVKLQERKEYHFNNRTIGFSNKFSAARYNGVSQLNDSTFVVRIEPENTPINRSPWYAFKVWGQQAQDIYIQLHYPTTTHRYIPKWSLDGDHWTAVNQVSLDEDKKNATFKVKLSKDTLTIAGQELMTAADTYQWIDRLAAQPFAEKELVGHSMLNRPIYAVRTQKSKGKKMIVIVGGQHPPEITGHLALRHFVDGLFSSTRQAKRFRKKYEIVVVPMLNPDGIEEGHWRHNMGGVDLNRDWIDFKQPETRAFSDYLTEKIHRQNAQVHFAIDFHSTFFDILYTNGEDPSNHKAGLMKDWITAIREAMPNEKIDEKPGHLPAGKTSKSWFHRAFSTETVTYEIGDTTSRELLKQKSIVAAEQLMKLLTK